MAKYQKKLQMFNSKVLLQEKSFLGSSKSDFELVTGSRLVFALSIQSIDPGASIVITVNNGFTIDFPFENILTFGGSAVGFVKRVLTDVHNLFDIEAIVVGGNANFALGVSISDNALTTRIDNAEIAVDLNHMMQANGTYDSVRLGDGVNQAIFNPDGSFNVNIVQTSILPEVQKNFPNEILNVPKNILTNIISYSAPSIASGKRAFVQRINAGG